MNLEEKQKIISEIENLPFLEKERKKCFICNINNSEDKKIIEKNLENAKKENKEKENFNLEDKEKIFLYEKYLDDSKDNFYISVLVTYFGIQGSLIIGNIIFEYSKNKNTFIDHSFLGIYSFIIFVIFIITICFSYKCYTESKNKKLIYDYKKKFIYPKYQK